MFGIIRSSKIEVRLYLRNQTHDLAAVGGRRQPSIAGPRQHALEQHHVDLFVIDDQDAAALERVV